MSVYVAMEEWTNCEPYEDGSDRSDIVGVFSSMDKAKAAIEEIVADRVRLVKEKDPNILITIHSEEDPHTLPGIYCEVRFDYQSVGGFEGPFRTYTFGIDDFEYTIQEFEIDSAKTMYDLNGGVTESVNKD